MQPAVTGRIALACSLLAGVSGGSAGGSPAPSPSVTPGKVTPPSGSLRPGTVGPISGKVEHCFGALGAQCGGAQFGLPVAALCSLGSCQINAGSWEHDQCCWDHPAGMACRAGPADGILGHDGNCVAEWNKALGRLQAGLNWRRSIDFNRPNATGQVNFPEYCAPRNTMVHQDDVRYCCSRAATAVPDDFRQTRFDRTDYATLRLCR